MLRLYHQSLSPFCRKVRLVLAEKGLEAELVEARPWEPSAEFRAIAPARETPVLMVSLDAAQGAEAPAVIADSVAIVEFLEEIAPERRLLPEDPFERAEARRLAQWFDLKFHREVTAKLVSERIYKRLSGSGAPDSNRIREGVARIRPHLAYMSGLLDRRRWLAGEALTIADFAAAAQISCIDYTGDVPWDADETVKQWYALVKSRPAFRSLLADRVPGMPPAKDYTNLDF